MLKRSAAVASALLGLLLLYFGYREIGRLGGTPLWPFRYIVLVLALFLLLSVAHWLFEREKPES